MPVVATLHSKVISILDDSLNTLAVTNFEMFEAMNKVVTDGNPGGIDRIKIDGKMFERLIEETEFATYCQQGEFCRRAMNSCLFILVLVVHLLLRISYLLYLRTI